MASGEFRTRQFQRDLFARAGRELDPRQIGFTFAGLQDIASPFMNTIMQGATLQGQQAAAGAQAGLARQGLGNTGLGATLGAGLQAGAGFAGRQIQARMFQDLLNEAIGIRKQRFNMFAQAGLQGPPEGGGFQDATDTAFRIGGMALQALGPLNLQGDPSTAGKMAGAASGGTLPMVGQIGAGPSGNFGIPNAFGPF